jgi:hypothetical protein
MKLPLSASQVHGPAARSVSTYIELFTKVPLLGENLAFFVPEVQYCRSNEGTWTKLSTARDASLAIRIG